MRATTFIDFTRLPVLRRVFFFTCALLLQACGGGGSDAGSSGLTFRGSLNAFARNFRTDVDGGVPVLELVLWNAKEGEHLAL